MALLPVLGSARVIRVIFATTAPVAVTLPAASALPTHPGQMRCTVVRNADHGSVGRHRAPKADEAATAGAPIEVTVPRIRCVNPVTKQVWTNYKPSN
jgi:hypothetical protein